MNIGRSLRTIFWLCGIGAAVTGWSTLLWPPVRFFYAQKESGFWSTVGELLLPINKVFPDGIFVGYIFLASTILLLFAVPLTTLRLLGALMRYVEISEADISPLKLSITLRFSDDLSKTTILRDQLFHANQPGTTAYHYHQTAHNPNGKILTSSFEMETAVNNKKLTKEFSVTATDRFFDAIEIFDRDLPVSFFATYLPDWIVVPLFKHTALFNSVVVRRNGQIMMENEHNGKEGLYELRSSRRSRNVTVTLDFPHDMAPKADAVRCFIIKGNVVSELHPKSCSTSDRRMYIAELNQLDKSSSLRLQWTNNTSENPNRLPIDGNPIGKQPNLLARVLLGWIKPQAPRVAIVPSSD